MVGSGFESSNRFEDCYRVKSEASRETFFPRANSPPARATAGGSAAKCGNDEVQGCVFAGDSQECAGVVWEIPYMQEFLGTRWICYGRASRRLGTAAFRFPQGLLGRGAGTGQVWRTGLGWGGEGLALASERETPCRYIFIEVIRQQSDVNPDQSQCRFGF